MRRARLSLAIRAPSWVSRCDGRPPWSSKEPRSTIRSCEPLSKRTVTIHGHEVSYRIGGPDTAAAGVPVLLLIHGMAGSSVTWREVAPALAKRVHRPSVARICWATVRRRSPGTTTRSAPFASGLRDLLAAAAGIERATLVGQSLGGGVAMQLAYQHPERCERLVLVVQRRAGPRGIIDPAHAHVPGRRVPRAGAVPWVRARDGQRREPTAGEPRGARAPTPKRSGGAMPRSPTLKPAGPSSGPCGPSSTCAVRRSSAHDRLYLVVEPPAR